VTIFDTPIDRFNTQSIKWSGLPSETAIPLCLADMDFPAPPAIVSALAARVAHGVYGYTGYATSLSETIAAWAARRYHWAIQPTWISMHQGVVTSLCTAIRALTDIGDKVIIQSPVYHPFYTAIRTNHRTVVENPLLLDRGHYRMDLDLLTEQAKDARLLILCNPHNPVGRVWSAEELIQLGQICLEHGVTVIADDIHADFTWAQPYRPFAALHNDFAENSITCLSPSKTFNVAGLNTSYEIIPNPALREKIRREKTGSGFNRPNLFGLLALETAYRVCDGWLDELLAYLAKSQALLREQFAAMAGIELIEPEGTYLAWLDCRQLGRSSDELVATLLSEAQVRLTSGRIFGTAGEGFLRMNYATNHASLTTALTRIAITITRLYSTSRSVS
jgi:cystathionine beta-lyase